MLNETFSVIFKHRVSTYLNRDQRRGAFVKARQSFSFMLDDSFSVSEDGGDLRKPGIHQDFFRFFTLTDNISTEGIQVDCITPTLSKQNGIFFKNHFFFPADKPF